MSLQDWKQAIKETNEIHKREGFLGKGRSDYNWYPSNWENIQKDPYCEEYKEVFLNLRFHGHIDDWNSYKVILERFEKKYKNTKSLRELIDEYINLKHLKWNKSFKKWNWKNFSFESNNLEKQFIKIENELINIFNQI